MFFIWKLLSSFKVKNLKTLTGTIPLQQMLCLDAEPAAPLSHFVDLD